jgi:sugar O-acyltransferase (sialic acid O-acetyltransferase NeuD family)
MTALVLVAASGLAREVLSVCAALGQDVTGVLDDDPSRAGGDLDGVPVLGGLEQIAGHPSAAIVVCAGRGAARRSIVGRLAGLGVTPDRYGRVVDPSVRIPAGCVVGQGTVLLANTVLTADVTVGSHVVCMPGVTLTHDDDVGDYATLAAGVSLGGGVRVGEAAYVGMNASVRENRVVGADAVLGMGSVLLRDQPPGSVWAGVPAGELRRSER